MEPLQIQCSHCQKSYLVSTQSLTFGEARFQCTSCESLFAINWTPELLDQAAQAGNYVPGYLPTYLIERQKKMKVCHKCSNPCFDEDVECSKCGVVFKKAEAQAVIRINSRVPELTKLWENVRKNYHDDNLHIEFIKMAATHEQLLYAAQQYRGILMVNPSETTALRMQKVVIELIESRKDVYGGGRDRQTTKTKMSFYKILFLTCSMFFAVGLIFQTLRPLIALSSSFMFFMLAYKFWIADSNS